MCYDALLTVIQSNISCRTNYENN